MFMHCQLIGAALLIYGIDVRSLADLAKYSTDLQSLVTTKFRTSKPSEKLGTLISTQETEMDEESDDTSQTDMFYCLFIALFYVV